MIFVNIVFLWVFWIKLFILDNLGVSIWNRVYSHILSLYIAFNDAYVFLLLEGKNLRQSNLALIKFKNQLPWSLKNKLKVAKVFIQILYISFDKWFKLKFNLRKTSISLERNAAKERRNWISKDGYEVNRTPGQSKTRLCKI